MLADNGQFRSAVAAKIRPARLQCPRRNQKQTSPRFSKPMSQNAVRSRL